MKKSAKKNIPFQEDWILLMKPLSDESFGKIWRTIVMCALKEMEPDLSDFQPTEQMAVSFIFPQVVSYMQKSKKISKSRQNAANAKYDKQNVQMDPNAEQGVQNMQMHPNGSKCIQMDPNAESAENQEKKVSKEKKNNNNINIFAKEEKQINKFICEKKKGLEERKRDFTASLEPYLEKYGKDMLNDFYSYWTETNDGGYKMRWEKEKTFCLSNRLSYWKRRDECSKRPKYITTNDAGIKLGYDERIETLPDGTKKRTYGKGLVTVPFEAPPREWGEIWGAQEKCWIQG